jgi:hypothetical protein
MSLHEAVHAVGVHSEAGRRYAKAVDGLASFFMRAQVHSTAQPYLNGAWLRGFDIEKWEFWASATDFGYGPWETETGWTIGWVSATLGMREMNTSFYDTMMRAAAVFDSSTVRTVCVDLFEDLASSVCAYDHFQ